MFYDEIDTPLQVGNIDATHALLSIMKSSRNADGCFWTRLNIAQTWNETRSNAVHMFSLLLV